MQRANLIFNSTHDAVPGSPYLTLTPDFLLFDPSGAACEGNTIQVRSNRSWTITYPEAWVHGPSSGSGDEDIEIYVDANSGGSRDSTVWFFIAGYGSFALTVDQIAVGGVCP